MEAFFVMQSVPALNRQYNAYISEYFSSELNISADTFDYLILKYRLKNALP